MQGKNKDLHKRTIERSILQLIWRLAGRTWEEPLFHQRSLLGVCRAGLRRATGVHWSSGTLFQIDISGNDSDGVGHDGPIEIRRGFVEDLRRFETLLSQDRLDLFEERLRRGRIWVYALHNGTVAGSAWMSFDDEFEPATEYCVELGKDDAYLFDCFAVPEYRGQGLQTMMTRYRLHLARSQGAKRAFVIVFSGNKASLRVQRRLGSKEVGRIFTLYLGRRSFHICSPRKWTAGRID